MPDACFSHVHIDVVGLYQYLLTCIDRYTRWSEALPMKDQTAGIIAETFYSGFISRFGVPDIVVSD